MDTSKGYYLELEQALYSLRIHFAQCQGAKNEEVLDWSKFFLDWSRKAVKYCGSWSEESLRNAENLAKNLEKPKVGVMGYEVLERAMSETAWNLNQEILKNLKTEEAGKVPAAV
jgi:hypothetical protein